MTRSAELGMIVRYEGEVFEVIGIGDGRSIIMDPLGKPPCPACGATGRVQLLEHSSLFAKVEPVTTLEIGAADD